MYVLQIWTLYELARPRWALAIEGCLTQTYFVQYQLNLKQIITVIEINRRDISNIKYMLVWKI